jgi:polysaccharide biosynthesis transport protein
MTLVNVLRVLARHKLLAGLAALLVPTAAVYFSLGQERRFEASAKVMLARQNLAAALTGIPNPDADLPAELLTATQARLARVSEVAGRAVSDTGLPDRDAQDLLENSSVSGDPTADILVFTVADSDGNAAKTLANAYAAEFIEYRRELETGSLTSVAGEIDRRLSDLRAGGARSSPLYKTLVAEKRQIETLALLQTPSARVIERSTTAKQTQPRPLRALILSIPLGILFGLALALLAHKVDTRVWSAPEIAHRLRLRLLGRIPRLPRRCWPTDRLVSLHRPESRRAGVFRVLQANLDLANRPHAASTIMFTSAEPREGKSFAVANLAVAFARAGKAVVLVDLNFGSSSIGSLFGLSDRDGVTEVLAGSVSVEDALVNVFSKSPGSSRRPTRGEPFALGGSLRVLTVGAVRSRTADAAGTPAISAMLEQAQRGADLVLAEAPALLEGGEAIALSAQVDGVVLVARARKTRRAVLGEVRRLLAASPAVKLGVVVTAADMEVDDVGDGLDAVADAPVGALAA